MTKLVIKKHSKRKLYDTRHSCFVNYRDLADYLRKGFQVIIIDQKTRKDVTLQVFSEILFQEDSRWVEQQSLSGLAHRISIGIQPVCA